MLKNPTRSNRKHNNFQTKLRVVWRGFVILSTVSVLIVGCAWWACIGLPAGDDAIDALESAGYHDIVLGSPSAYRCGQDSDFSNTFTALNVNRRQVEGVVCCERRAAFLGKESMIRY